MFKETQKVPKTVARPTALVDKTPFVNRGVARHQTPAPSGITKKLIESTPVLFKVNETTPPSSQRPSATRARLRIPVRSAYETPAPGGRHWDVSDGSIDVSRLSGSVTVDSVGTPVVKEYDDIEYMPPTAVGERHAVLLSTPLTG